ncbi:MAG: ABC transporter ATP-binding protein [Deltaproteobacteria bacterium]|nr:ABC transporter ATP-binding protein [Deltaproteobacteria bacterium]
MTGARSTDEARIGLRGLSKSFSSNSGTVAALASVDLEVRDSEFVCVVGPSGCGKTTLLRCLAGIETPDRGTIDVRGDAARSRPRLAMVFQQPGLYPWMSVRENLEFVLRACVDDQRRRTETIDGFLEEAGLARFASFYPYQLSGGMMQRVALVRAFCVGPEVLLMDEPFVFLDYQNRLVLQNVLLKLWIKRRPTIVFVTHNINEAAALADRVVVLTRRPGTIRREVACPFERPRDVIGLRQNPEYQNIVVEITRLLGAEAEDSERDMERADWKTFDDGI